MTRSPRIIHIVVQVSVTVNNIACSMQGGRTQTEIRCNLPGITGVDMPVIVTVEVRAHFLFVCTSVPKYCPKMVTVCDPVQSSHGTTRIDNLSTVNLPQCPHSLSLLLHLSVFVLMCAIVLYLLWELRMKISPIVSAER